MRPIFLLLACTAGSSFGQRFQVTDAQTQGARYQDSGRKIVRAAESLHPAESLQLGSPKRFHASRTTSKPLASLASLVAALRTASSWQAIGRPHVGEAVIRPMTHTLLQSKVALERLRMPLRMTEETPSEETPSEGVESLEQEAARYMTWARERIYSTLPLEIFESQEWANLEVHLDTIPTFIVANAKSEPLMYMRGTTPISVVFTDPEQAVVELNDIRKRWPDTDWILQPIGLGSAFKKHIMNKAYLVPSPTAIAGAGEGWDDDVVPLYTCFYLTSNPPVEANLEVPAGQAATPLFLSPEDARENLQQAIDAMPEKLTEEQLAGMQLVVTSMPIATQIVVSGQEEAKIGGKFQFIAPKKSISFLKDQEVLSLDGVMAKVQDQWDEFGNGLFPR